MITITDAARDELTREMNRLTDGGILGLRINVTPGGCAGYQYGLTFERIKTDHKTDIHSINGVNVLIQPAYLDLLTGMTIDYQNDLMGAGFRIDNPNTTGGCGCGKSFAA